MPRDWEQEIEREASASRAGHAEGVSSKRQNLTRRHALRDHLDGHVGRAPDEAEREVEIVREATEQQVAHVAARRVHIDVEASFLQVCEDERKDALRAGRDELPREER